MPDELVDLADGIRQESAEPHLAVCQACRLQLAELRVLLADVADVPVPEPSPLFWDHLSARVRAAVKAERRPLPWQRRVGEWSWAVASAFGVAVAVLAVVVALRSPERSREVPRPAAGVTTAGATVERLPFADDPSLSLLADLAAEMEWDAAAAGMVANVGNADAVIDDLTADERAELRRLLDEVMAGRGA